MSHPDFGVLRAAMRAEVDKQLSAASPITLHPLLPHCPESKP